MKLCRLGRSQTGLGVIRFILWALDRELRGIGLRMEIRPTIKGFIL